LVSISGIADRARRPSHGTTAVSNASVTSAGLVALAGGIASSSSPPEPGHHHVDPAGRRVASRIERLPVESRTRVVRYPAAAYPARRERRMLSRWDRHIGQSQQ